MHIQVAGLSDQGLSRQHNDDHYCIGHWVEQNAFVSCTFDCQTAFFQQYGLLTAVADGMGGYSGGSYASQKALEILMAQFYGESRAGCSKDEFNECLRRYLLQTQKLLSGALKRKEGFEDAGTTIAGLAMLSPDYLLLFHAGDSRIVRASGGFIRTLTIDHTPIGPDIASGRIAEEDAATFPEATQLTRSLGVRVDSEVELSADYTWVAGDVFLIGTDGWYGVGRGLSRDTIRRLIHEECDINSLLKRCILESVQSDGKDNSTLVIVNICEDNDHE